VGWEKETGRVYGLHGVLLVVWVAKAHTSRSALLLDCLLFQC